MHTLRLYVQKVFKLPYFCAVQYFSTTCCSPKLRAVESSFYPYQLYVYLSVICYTPLFPGYSTFFTTNSDRSRRSGGGRLTSRLWEANKKGSGIELQRWAAIGSLFGYNAEDEIGVSGFRLSVLIGAYWLYRRSAIDISRRREWTGGSLEAVFGLNRVHQSFMPNYGSYRHFIGRKISDTRLPNTEDWNRIMPRSDFPPHRYVRGWSS